MANDKQTGKTRTYIVLSRGTILKDGKSYVKGDEIELTDVDASAKGMKGEIILKEKFSGNLEDINKIVALENEIGDLKAKIGELESVLSDRQKEIKLLAEDKAKLNSMYEDAKSKNAQLAKMLEESGGEDGEEKSSGKKK